MTDEPTKKIDSSDEPTQRIEHVERSRGGRRFLAVLVVIALIGAGVFYFNPGKLLPEWMKNPFAEQTTVKTQPPVLISIRDLARFVAAEGNFEVVVDLKKDRKYVPDWLLNERTLFVGAGSVEAYVEFSGLTEDKIKVDEATKTVTVELPEPELADPKLDLERSYVFAESQGLFNKIGEFFGGDPNRQRETLLVAEQRIASAAAASTLRERAKENTRKTLEGIMHSLGYENVVVNFVPDPN